MPGRFTIPGRLSLNAGAFYIPWAFFSYCRGVFTFPWAFYLAVGVFTSVWACYFWVGNFTMPRMLCNCWGCISLTVGSPLGLGCFIYYCRHFSLTVGAPMVTGALYLTVGCRFPLIQLQLGLKLASLLC
jgi:hypothetical protein